LTGIGPLLGQDPVGQGVILRDVALRKPVHALLEDHDGFIWIGANDGLFRYDGFETDPVGYTREGPDQLKTFPVFFLLEDSLNNLWAAGTNGLFLFSPDRTRSVRIDPSVLGDEHLSNLTRIREIAGRIWVFTGSTRIACFRPPLAFDSPPKADQVLDYNFNWIDGRAYVDNRILLESVDRSRYMVITQEGQRMAAGLSEKPNTTYFLHSPGNQVLAMASPDLYRVDPETMAFTLERSFQQELLKPTPCWLENSRQEPDRIWIGSSLGHLFRYSLRTRRYQDFSTFLAARLYEGRFFGINTLMEDRHGGLWIGTNQGLAYLRTPNQQTFQALPRPGNNASALNFSTRGLFRLRDGSLFVSSYAGLYRYTTDGRIREYRVWNDVENHAVIPLAYDFLQERNRIWMASEGNGILYYDMATDSVYRVVPSSVYAGSDNAEFRNTQWCFRVFRDKAGVRWAGTNQGLFHMDNQGELWRPEELQDAGTELRKIYDLLETPDSTLWIGAGTGLYSVSADRKTLTPYPFPADRRMSVTCLHADMRGNLWLGTRDNGLWTYSPSSGEFNQFDISRGLPDNTICAIRETPDGALWVSTNSGLTRLDMRLMQCSNFFAEDGLPDNEFNHGSSLQDVSGRLYFGGVGGVVFFDPATTLEHGAAPALRISKIVSHDGNAGRSVVTLYNSDHRPSLRLGAADKYFTIYYSTNAPTPNSRESFAYKLVGLHDEWQSNGDRNSIQFTGLSAGQHTLQIRSLNHPLGAQDDIIEIPVFIARPFYLRWWAFPIYAILLSLAGFLFMRSAFRRKHMERQLLLETEHKTRLEEINRSKSTFFTNITHEFKTPLTLIHGPAEEIARQATDPQIIRQADLISRNAKSILGLVNQLLDLGKLEANLDEPKYYRLDLVQQVRHWMEKFQPLARQKEIRLGFECDQPSLYSDFDPVKLETVVNNLLSNAVKFTPENGRVKCTVRMAEGKTDQVQILVEDTGPGIPAEEQGLVFDRFYQGANSVSGGTGIGLSFVREMVRVHGGQVGLVSTPGEGTRFTVTLPMFQAGSIHASPFPGAPALEEETVDAGREGMEPGHDSRPVVLVVEDNPDVAMLVMDVLGGEHTMLHALNGRDGHTEAVRQVPDLIITDVMMPVMDGYTMTHLLRQDVHTAHIPVIMLTARDGEASRIEGRAHGADVYLEKPFSVRELQLVVRNLLLLKKRLAEQAAGQVREDVTGIVFATEADNTFYQQFLAIIEENLSESDLSVEDFTSRLGISRTQLHRKLKALTGHSVNQLVRNMRLQRALALLQHSGQSIAEVGYAVGFSSPSYFTERFREHYGYPPSEAVRPGAGR